MSLLLRSAIALGATPLILGSLIYVTWRLTRWPFLEMMGLLALPLGFIAFLIGTTCLIVHLRNETRIGITAQRTLIPRALMVGGLLILNFPAAAFYTGSAIKLHTRYTVEVRNESGQPIDSLSILGPGVNTAPVSIAPGKTIEQHLRFKHDGELTFSLNQHGSEIRGVIEPYVTGGLGGHATLRIHPRGVSLR
ncbi:MAG: hypothetical protein RL346_1137 [Verrucomicrobiota bacterium]|jgi:hypothetical protein